MQLAIKAECTRYLCKPAEKKKNARVISDTWCTQTGTRKEGIQTLEAREANGVKTETRVLHINKRYRHMEHIDIREERQTQL